MVVIILLNEKLIKETAPACGLLIMKIIMMIMLMMMMIMKIKKMMMLMMNKKKLIKETAPACLRAHLGGKFLHNQLETGSSDSLQTMVLSDFKQSSYILGYFEWQG